MAEEIKNVAVMQFSQNPVMQSRNLNTSAKEFNPNKTFNK
jgi:hypothetical protein